jgi:hypothetical protein
MDVAELLVSHSGDCGTLHLHLLEKMIGRLHRELLPRYVTGWLSVSRLLRMPSSLAFAYNSGRENVP